MTRGSFLAAVAVAVALLPPPAHALPRGTDGRTVRDAHRALLELRVEDAQRLVGPVLGRHPDDPDALHVSAMVLFYRGDYANAARALEASLAQAPATPRDERPEMLELIRDTAQATAGFATARSPDGRFVIRHAPGPDAELVPYAMEALGKADAALTEALGVRHPGPIRLELYGSPADLARVSTLTVEAIERTGTIALCKWDRLMVVSPRALVRGYPWLDTVAHEMVHLLLARGTHDNAPVWLQEGVAKFLERRWRDSTPRAHLEPASAGLLAEALTGGTLLPFERLHPSIALLDSQRDAALAFAQVSTFVESFHAAHGREGLQQAVLRIARGEDAKDALAAVAAESFDVLERRWRDDLAHRPAPADPPRLLGMRFRHGEGEPDESTDVTQEDARRHLRLGDMLWARRRPGAAAREYAAAQRVAPEDPIVVSRLAHAALAAGEPERAEAALGPVVARYPEHAPARALLGSALRARGDFAGARREAEATLQLNPFDPRPHCDLAAAAETAERRAAEAEACRRLGGVPAQGP